MSAKADGIYTQAEFRQPTKMVSMDAKYLTRVSVIPGAGQLSYPADMNNILALLR